MNAANLQNRYNNRLATALTLALRVDDARSLLNDAFASRGQFRAQLKREITQLEQMERQAFARLPRTSA